VDTETKGYKKNKDSRDEIHEMHIRIIYQTIEETEIFRRINANPVEKKLVQYKQKWLHYVNRMEDITQKYALTIDLLEDLEDR